MGNGKRTRTSQVKTIYTAIFGNYDDLKEPLVVTKGWRYLVFTDQDLKSDVWEVRKVPVMKCGPAKTARYYKIMFQEHIESEFSIWIDATFIINVNLNTWWKRFTKPFTVVKHPFDSCIYTDAENCLRMGRGEKDMIERQIALYKALNIQKNTGLISSGVLMRQKTLETARFCELWWNQVKKWSNRDQIAFGYALKKNPELPRFINWNYTKATEFLWVPHLHKFRRNERMNELLAKYGPNSSEKRSNRTVGHTTA